MIHIASKNTKSKFDTEFEQKAIQPNAYDISLNRIFKMNDSSFILSEDAKHHRGSTELMPDDVGYFKLPVGTYEFTAKEIIQVGEGEAGWIITRSTLNRNGLYITSGLYDSGYHGVMAGALHVTGASALIKQDSRIGQFLLFKAETLNMYDGDYGINKEHDNKYKGEK